MDLIHYTVFSLGRFIGQTTEDICRERIFVKRRSIEFSGYFVKN